MYYLIYQNNLLVAKCIPGKIVLSIKDTYLGIITIVNALNLKSTRINEHLNLITMI